MKFTVDLTREELDCIGRALIAHIHWTTDALRSRAAAQLSRVEVQRCWSDIRVAAILVGRLVDQTGGQLEKYDEHADCDADGESG